MGFAGALTVCPAKMMHENVARNMPSARVVFAFMGGLSLNSLATSDHVRCEFFTTYTMTRKRLSRATESSSKSREKPRIPRNFEWLPRWSLCFVRAKERVVQPEKPGRAQNRSSVLARPPGSYGRRVRWSICSSRSSKTVS